MDFNIEEVKTILKNNVKKTTEDDICILDSSRTQLFIMYLDKRREQKELEAFNKNKQGKAKLEGKGEDKKINKREIEAGMADSIFEDTKKEIGLEYEYKLYEGLISEIKEKINLRKKIFTDK